MKVATRKGSLVPSPYAPAAEPFRMLRASLELWRKDRGTTAILFTSPSEGDGKSTVASNYACAAAAHGSRVLLVDADVRRPALHEIFRLPLSPGVTDLLVGGDRLHWARPVAAYDSLRVLTAGRPIGVADIVASARMATLLEEAVAEYDLVVVDTPPVLMAAETGGIAGMQDVCAVLVVTPATNRRALRRSLQKLELTGANVAGIVLNREGRLSTYGY